MMEIEAIRHAQEKGRDLSYELALSTLTFAIASPERLDDLDASQTNRVRQAVVRLSNLERKLSRG